jgi:hypothetical protein
VQRYATSGSTTLHSVAAFHCNQHIDAVRFAGPLNRPVMYCECDSVTLLERNDLRPTLHPQAWQITQNCHNSDRSPVLAPGMLAV